MVIVYDFAILAHHDLVDDGTVAQVNLFQEVP